MGLFSSKKKTVVDTFISRVVEDDQIPDTGKKGIIEAVLEGSSVSASVLEAVLNGPALRFERAYQYGKSGYYYGLPNIKVHNIDAAVDKIKEALPGITGKSVDSFVYAEYAPLNHTHVAWQELTVNYDYDHVTNIIGKLSDKKGTAVYLDKITPVYGLGEGEDADSGTLVYWGKSSMSGYTPERAAQTYDSALGEQVLADAVVVGADQVDSAVIQYVYADEDGEFVKETLTLDLTNYEDEAEYFQVCFESGGSIHYWTYQDGAGTYPELDVLYSLEYTDPGTYFPFLVFRHHDTNRTSDSLMETEEFKSASKLADYYGFDFKEMGDTIHANPDINDIDQAVMMMAVPMNSDNEIEIKYLFKYFSALHGDTLNYVPGIMDNIVAKKAGNAFTVYDSDFKVTISYKGIERRIKAGNLNAEYTRTEERETFTSIYYDEFDIEQTKTTHEDHHIYRHQIGTGIYEELKVLNPTFRFHITGREVSGGAKDDRLLIPIDKDIGDTFPPLEREKLYFRSLRFVFNARKTYRVKWYERGIFRDLLMIVAVVITIYTGGAAWQSIVAASAAGLAAVAMVVFNYILKAIIVDYTFRLVVKEIGIEAAFLLALASAITGMGMKGFGGNNFMADNLLQVSTSLSNASSSVLKEMSQDLLEDTKRFGEYADNKLDDLTEAQKDLDMQSLIDPNVFVGKEPLVIVGESPNDYFSRTIHAGNIGRSSIDIVESFVDVSLKLPDMNETLRGTV